MKRIIFIYFGAGLLWCLSLLYIPNLLKTLERWVDLLARQWTTAPNPGQIGFRDPVMMALQFTFICLPALLPCAAIGWKLAKLENPAETTCNRVVMAFGTMTIGSLVLVPILIFVVMWGSFR